MHTRPELQLTQWRTKMTPNTKPAAKENRPSGNHLKKLTLVTALVLLCSTAINGKAATANTSFLKSVAITDAAGTNAPPTAVINYTKNGDVYTFDASQSSDADGTIVSNKWNFGNGTLVEGQTINQQITANPTQVTLTVADDKGGVAITQTEVTAYTEPFDLTADDADTTAFNTAGTWAQSTSIPGYYNVGYKTAPPGTGSATTTWTLSLPTSGTYNVSCYYTQSSNRASNAPFILINNGQEIARVAVNQQKNGGFFFSIGSYSLTKGMFEIIMTNGGDGYSIADAVKVAYIP